MLKKIIKKISTLSLLFIFSLSFISTSFAQSSSTNPLQNIKDQLKSEGINVIDYSNNLWGKLTPRIIEILKEEYEWEENDSWKDGDKEGLPEIIESTNINNLEEDLTEKLGNISDLSNEDIQLIINETYAYQYYGERQARDVVQGVVKVIRNVIGGLAIIWIIISGITMIFVGGDEGKITESKKGILYGVIGLVSILLIERFIDIIYGAPGTYISNYGTGYVNVLDPIVTEARFSAEIYGLVNFLKSITGVVAVLMIIISGISTIAAGGEEEQLTKQKKVFMWIIIGLILMLIDQTIIDNIFTIPVQGNSDQIGISNVTTIINLIGRIIQFGLGFVGIIALTMLIYGSGLMITNFGNDEAIEKSKKIIKNALIGIIVIISAYTIVSTLIVFK